MCHYAWDTGALAGNPPSPPSALIRFWVVISVVNNVLCDMGHSPVTPMAASTIASHLIKLEAPDPPPPIHTPMHVTLQLHEYIN